MDIDEGWEGHIAIDEGHLVTVSLTDTMYKVEGKRVVGDRLANI